MGFRGYGDVCFFILLYCIYFFLISFFILLLRWCYMTVLMMSASDWGGLRWSGGVVIVFSV